MDFLEGEELEGKFKLQIEIAESPNVEFLKGVNGELEGKLREMEKQLSEASESSLAKKNQVNFFPFFRKYFSDKKSV